MGEGNGNGGAPAPRRKRIQNNNGGTTTTVIVGNGKHHPHAESFHEYHNGTNNDEFSKNNGAASFDDAASASSAAAPSSASSSSRAGVNGRAKARARRKRNYQKKKYNLSFAVYIAKLLSFGLVGFTIIFMLSSRSAKKLDIENDYDRILSNILPNDDDKPLTEEQEQQILQAAQSELNQFPISIGKDTTTTAEGQKNNNNPNWETIQHPGTEALEYFTGDSSMKKKKKRASASDIAAVLSGKQLRGSNTNNDADTGDVSDSVEEGYMRVPKFWDPAPYRIIADEREKRSIGTPNTDENEIPRDGGVRRYLGNYGSRLMTPAEAKSIGSHIPSKDNNGETIMLETIFVAVASYRDWQCSSTVESAFLRATHPERVRVAVVDQIRLGEDTSCSVPPKGSCEDHPEQATCKYQSQIDYFTVDSDLSVGPVFARHLGHRLYRGEYFAMQSDAHVSFVTNWDNEIIAQWHQAKNEMAVLSTYLSGTEDHINLDTGERTSKSRPVMCESDFEGHGANKHLRHGQQPEGVPFLHEPVLDPYWAAGFSFGRGHFVVNVPYDQHLPWIFQGEEISIGLRGFSYGYDYYSPEKSVCYHFYGRKDIPMFWENVDIFRGSGVYGMNRLNAIIHMKAPSINGESQDWIRKDEVKYGIGKVRDLQRFFDVFGIHVETQTVEKHLCRFVGRPMQKEFLPFLRKNEMGIDYDKITYRFVDKT